jgi:hypothetical protein
MILAMIMGDNAGGVGESDTEDAGVEESDEEGEVIVAERETINTLHPK